MGTYVGQLVHPGTGLSRPMYAGWSWPAFFFGCLWYFVKGMWGYGFIYLLVSATVIGWPFALFIAPMWANRQLTEHLGGKGYVRASATGA